MSATERKPHTVRIKHDPDSHAAGDDCHDDCTAEVICPGVTDACRTWWECGFCIDLRLDMDDAQLDEHDELLFEDGEAHGEAHQRIDGMWMTPSDECRRILALLDALEAAEAEREKAKRRAAECEDATFDKGLLLRDQRARADAAEADVARLTADRDSRHNAWAAAVKQANAAEARAAKAEALVEAGLGLADEFEQLANLASGSVAVPVALRAHAQELRAALGGAK